MSKGKYNKQYYDMNHRAYLNISYKTNEEMRAYFFLLPLWDTAICGGFKPKLECRYVGIALQKVAIFQLNIVHIITSNY